jgi:hypothetical protein
MPAVINRDRDVIKTEIQPAAPIIRADGTSIRDSLFMFVKEQENALLKENTTNQHGSKDDNKQQDDYKHKRAYIHVR